MTDRRNFLKKMALATAGASLATSMPFSMNSFMGANEKLVCGLIGANGMGFSNLKAFLNQPNTECAAICDVDENVLKRSIAETEKIQKKRPKGFKDYRKMLEMSEIDVIIIGTPDHWHCLQMVEACQAGKDVYCEKPLANTIEEIDVMERAASKYNTVVQVGMWQRSDPHWRDAVDFVKSGQLGKVRTVRTWAYQGWMEPVPVKPDSEAPAGVDYDLWLGPAPLRPFNPNRFHFNFRWYYDYAGGLMTDWGVHIIDYGLFGMGDPSPKSIMAMGGKFAYPNDAAETPDTLQALYEFDGHTMLWDHGTGIDGGYYGRDHGVGFVGNNGTLVVDRNGWEVIPEKKKGKDLMKRVDLIKGSGKGLDLHMANFIDGIKTRNRNLNANIAVAANTARVAHLGNIAHRTGQRLYWDADNNQIINNKEASKLLSVPYRAPWKLPTI